MSAQTISIDFPADIFLALNETENELKQRIKIPFAVWEEITLNKTTEQYRESSITYKL